ncbi:PREDICTED: uncharacterized protein LOC109157107 [Ipomoea nil]|uniref:uncharacterized protein LOC109157107 n=1 Tax=Ipomoea nil TaxID=35883 RepID=UPI000901A5E9|nr:PREDICTED: uncharacterized protein LOC109157107 [Ipomoea nil]
MPNLVFSATESENSRKRCRVCQRPKTVKQFKPIGKAKFSDHGRPSSIRVTTLEDDMPSNQSSHFCFTSGSNERGNENGVFLGGVSSGIGSVASSSYRPEFDFVKTEVRHEFTPETEGIPEDNSCFSREVSDAIKQIEMHISALQLEAKSGTNVIGSESRDTVADCFLQMDISSAIKRTKGLVASSDPCQARAVVNDSQYHLDRQCSVEPINSLYQGPIRMMNQLTDSTSPNLAANQATMTREHMRNADLVSKHNVSGRGEEPIDDDHEMQILKGNWLALQDLKTILNKLESAREPNSSGHGFANRTTPDRKGYSISQGQNKTVNTLSALPAINRDQDLVPLNPNPRKPRIPKSTVQLKDSEKDLQHHKTTRQTWLDSKESKHGHLIEARKNLYKSLKDLNHFGLSRKEKFTNYPKRRYLLEQEPEATVSSSYSSQPRSTYGSHTEDYSESGHHQNYTDAPISGSCSDSELYPSHLIRRRSRYINDSSSCENEAYSPSFPDSASFLRRSSTHSGESEASSQSSQPVNSYSNDSSSKTCSPVRAYKSASVEKTKKQVGRWTKFKDKLGIIFHHHHHHHHHQNNDKKAENTTNHRTKVNHETPLPKHKGKSPCPPRKHEVHEEQQQAVQKLGKPVVCDQRGKSQHGSHFHALVQGLKNSKSLKHGNLQSKKGRHGNKQAVKTSHWWELLRQHGRFKKPPALLEYTPQKNFVRPSERR